MTSMVLLILVGLAVGVFVISLGGGGGAIYLGVLTALFQLPPASAAATSIVTALPALVLGSWSYYRKGLINVRLGNRMMVAASATSAYVLVGMSVVGALLHLTGGTIDWQVAGGLIIGSLVGSILAPPVIIWMTKKPHRAFYIKLFMGLFIIVMGIKTMI